MSARFLVAAAAVLLASSGAARAQVNLARLDDERVKRVQVRTGAEYGFVAGLGYAHAVALLDRTWLIGADVTLPWAAPDAGDWRLRASALVPVVAGESWKLAASVAPSLRATSNGQSRMTGLGIDLGAVGGYYAKGWFLGGELGLDWEITTHVAHGESYRRSVFADARDGWYASPGGNLRLGVQGGLSFSRYDVVLRVGKLRDFKGAGPMLPVYGTIGVDTRF